MRPESTMRELLRLSLPIVVSQGAFAVMVFTDRLFMSFLSPAHIAAALGGGVASFFCMSLFLGLISYGNALVAQYYGAGQLQKCPRVTSQAVILSLASSPLLLIAALWGGDVFALMGHDPRQVPLERAYFQVLMAGSVFTLIKVALASYFSGIGMTRVVMVADVLGTALNVPLTWVLVFGKLGLPALGIVGAALGSVVSVLFSILVFLYFYCGREHRRRFDLAQSLRFDRGIMRRYLRLGLPSGLENFMNTATFNVFLLLFQSYGVVQGAAMAIVFNWDMLSFIPMVGLNIGVMSLIGRFVGAGDMARANKTISAGFVLAFAYSGSLALLFLCGRYELVALFDNGGEDFSQILELGAKMMLGLVTYMLADATMLIAGGALRGAGDTRWILLTSVSVHGLMLLAQYLVIVVYRLGPMTSWWVFVAMLIVLALLYLGRLLRGSWRDPQRLARVMHE
ncbi:MAG: MATE family efflux transporter [Halioglobus sp.]|nr:MATE family efflux transporter [Halioglobus sp.]|tara:strand:+ start:2203 stop:3564 length:1362 start_codon:yes stop_codon:yes gene_type:complete